MDVEMIDVAVLRPMLEELSGMEGSAHIKWAMLNERTPEPIKDAFKLVLHLTAGNTLLTNEYGVLVCKMLGGDEMGRKYANSVGSSATARSRYVSHLPDVGFVDPSIAAAYLLVCSPVNASATIQRLVVQKYDLGPYTPVAISTPKG
jgi:hypothetical protein